MHYPPTALDGTPEYVCDEGKGYVMVDPQNPYMTVSNISMYGCISPEVFLSTMYSIETISFKVIVCWY